MTCQYFGVVCLLWSIVMTSIVRCQEDSADTKSRLVPPVIVEGPNSYVCFLPTNDRKEFPCVATGTPPLEYTWFVNGKKLALGDRVRIYNGTLIINKPDLDMEGFYQCHARNKAGVAVSNITFFQAAVFDTFLSPRERKLIRPINVSEFDHLELPCNHINRSIPPANIIWDRSTDGESNFRKVELDSRVTVSDTGSLLFSFVNSTDIGVYRCTAYNPVVRRDISGSKFKINKVIQDPILAMRKLQDPPVLLYASSNATVLEGEDLHLTCIFGAWPQPRIQWTTPHGLLSATGPGSGNHTLVIRNVSSVNAGMYSCQADKTVNSLTVPVYISVTVDAIPSFTAAPSNQEIYPGQNTTFICRGRARPAPIVTWYIDGEVTALDNVKEDVKYSISGNVSTSVLTFTNLQTTVTVTCNISNAHGYRLHNAYAILALEADSDVVSTSQGGLVSSLEPEPSAGTSRTYHHILTSSPSQIREVIVSSTTVETKGGTKDPLKSEQPSSLSSTTIIIVLSVSICVVVLSVIVVVVCIVRRKKRNDAIGREERAVPDNQPLHDLPRPRLINERTYDSDDSGFDDVNAENPDRRHLRQHLASS